MAIITVASIKGGVGKSTLAIHIAAALQSQRLNATLIDADIDQLSSQRFLHRRTTRLNGSAKAVLSLPEIEIDSGTHARIRFENMIRDAARAGDVIIDLPGSRSQLMKPALVRSQIVVTPINESFVDLDVIGSRDGAPGPLTESILQARQVRADQGLRPLRWTIIRNRLSTLYSRNAEAVDERLRRLAENFDFDIGPGLTERVVFRELHDEGLTLLDAMNDETVRPTLSAVAARSELRAVMENLALPSRF